MRYLFLTLIIFTSLKSFSQGSRFVLPYKWAASISPFALADIDHAVMVGGEYRLKTKWALAADLGYVFDSEYFDNAKKSSGINSRFSFRYYRGYRDNEFWQAQLLYKQVDYTINDWLGKSCVNGVPSYDQLQDFVFRKQVWGFNLMAGEIKPIFSNRFFTELTFGLGVRYKKQTVIKQGNACYDDGSTGMFNLKDDKTWAPSLPLSLKLYYVIR